MRKTLAILFLVFSQIFFSQKLEFKTLLEDKISIRALEVWDHKVWYSGTDSKFGYVSLNDDLDKKQLKLSQSKLQFRTLAQNKKYFNLISIESPAYFFMIEKKDLKVYYMGRDTLKTAFFDAEKYDEKGRGIRISDPKINGKVHLGMVCPTTKDSREKVSFPKYFLGEAHFAASNTNIAMKKDWVWIATGGSKARIFKFNWEFPFYWTAYETPFIQGTSSQGIYSIDFYDENFGIAVGGDYTKQAENFNNIATTNDGGETWQIQASGKNGGYKTCVKIRPKSKGKDIIAVGDQNIEFSNDFGKTWTKISDEKNLYVCEWIDENTLVFAGKDRILKAEFYQ